MLSEQRLKATPPLLGRARKRLLGLSLEEANFARRGFRAGDAHASQHLERIGHTFLRGYHAALEESAPAPLTLRLEETESELRGFAYEGAAMGMALLDRLTPWMKSRWHAYVNGPGSPHVYMMHVGVGWVIARLRLRVAPQLERLDPLLRWLAVDGYGFHEGYFGWRRYVAGQAMPGQLEGYARRVFDQGLGRSLWFVFGADVRGIAEAIAAFGPSRRPDLWSGVGLAGTYAGGVGVEALRYLLVAAGLCRAQVAQGAAFAAKTRLRASNLVPHTELACRILCGLTAADAAEVTDLCLAGLPANGEVQSYEVWRERIQVQLGGRL